MMSEKEIVLGLVGSPNPDGRTNRLVRAALEGAAMAGAVTELIQMSEHVVTACKDCLPWVCAENQKCTYEDDAFEFLSRKVLNCGALILGTPVYWWDTSAMMKYFILKMFRVFARSAPLQGLPAFGISIAGGTGNGLVSGLRPVYHFFQVMQMRALEPLPATRFNFHEAETHAKAMGGRIASIRHKRHPFAGLEQRLLWYDQLPYFGLSRAEERRLLAALTALALPREQSGTVTASLARADLLAAAGDTMGSMIEITKCYEAGVNGFEG
jgi:multimeric flavodoxin WrbA